MPIVSTTSEVTCPRCGAFPATFVQNDYYAMDRPAPVDQRLELLCPNGCVPSQKMLRVFCTSEVQGSGPEI